MDKEEDGTNLIKLFFIVWTKKIFIFILTFIITCFAMIYAYNITPIYEVKATIEIGHIDRKFIEDPYSFIKKTPIVFQNSSLLTNDSKISKINLVPKSKNLVDIKVQAHSLKNAEKSFNIILQETIKKHNVKIDNYITNIKLQSKLLHEEKLKLEKRKTKIINNINDLRLLIIKLTSTSPTNATLHSLTLSNYVKEMGIINERESSIDSKLLVQKELLSSRHFETTKLLGKLHKNSRPVKPKKQRIIVAGAISGFMFSIFLVFFMNFIKTLKEEES